MTRDVYNSLLERGYHSLLDYQSGLEEYDQYALVELDQVTLRGYLFGGNELSAFSEDGSTVLFYHVEHPYFIEPLLLRDFLLSTQEKEDITGFLERSHLVLDGVPFIVPQCRGGKLPRGDIFFSDVEHIVAFVLTSLEDYDRRTPLANVREYAEFLEEAVKLSVIPERERVYSDTMLSLIVWNQAFETEVGEDITEHLDFYIENLTRLAEKGVYRSMRQIGYEYYEGCNGFPYDPARSLYWLKKAYDMRQEPDIARTLGYIYYYGRTTGGVPDGDNAFRYFAIGHLAGGYYEATYKLADCYVHGYGTPVCYEAAYRLVLSVYKDSWEGFMNGENFTKLADAALRLGSYFRDGIYAKVDHRKAYSFYLEARSAIKERLSAGEYIGDRGVAAGIYHSLKELSYELGSPSSKRKFDQGGLVVDLPSMEKVTYLYPNNLIIKRENNGVLRLISDENGVSRSLLRIPELGICERISSFEMLLYGDIDARKHAKIVSLDPEQITFINGSVIFSNESADYEIAVPMDKMILLPLKDVSFEKKYCLVSVAFAQGSKTYDYLCRYDAKPGDTVMVSSSGKDKLVDVKEVTFVYEDELPLPLAKMSWAKKPDSF